MSHLAAQLGNPREIAQLARAAQEGARGQVTPRAQAMFLGAEARGHALMGDPSQCHAVAGRALTALEHADPEHDDDPVWIAHFDHAYLADELAHCYRDLGEPEAAARHAADSLSGHPESRSRRRAIGLVLLATAQVQQREVEEACRTGTRAAELLGTLRSSRGRSIWTTSSSGWSRTARSPRYGSSVPGWRSRPRDTALLQLPPGARAVVLSCGGRTATARSWRGGRRGVRRPECGSVTGTDGGEGGRGAGGAGMSD